MNFIPTRLEANAFDEDKKNAYKAGMNWHIAKPIRVEELMSALTEILKGQKKTGDGFISGKGCEEKK